MRFVERLLIREEIDSLELDLSRARDISDDEAIAEVGARIARLEAILANACLDRWRSVDGEPGHPIRRVA